MTYSKLFSAYPSIHWFTREENLHDCIIEDSEVRMLARNLENAKRALASAENKIRTRWFFDVVGSHGIEVEAENGLTLKEFGRRFRLCRDSSNYNCISIDCDFYDDILFDIDNVTVYDNGYIEIVDRSHKIGCFVRDWKGFLDGRMYEEII